MKRRLSRYAYKQIIKKRVCHQKRQYFYKADAWSAAWWMFTQLGHFQTPYECKYCHTYHLTQSQAQPSVPPEYISRLTDWFGLSLKEFEKTL